MRLKRNEYEKRMEVEDEMMQIDNKLIIQMPRYVAVIYVNELQDLLSQNRELWTKAIQRGKSEMRFQKEQGRVAKGGASHE